MIGGAPLFYRANVLVGNATAGPCGRVRESRASQFCPSMAFCEPAFQPSPQKVLRTDQPRAPSRNTSLRELARGDDRLELANHRAKRAGVSLPDPARQRKRFLHR